MKHLVLLLVTLWITCVAPSALAENLLVIRFSHVVASESPKGQAAERFAQLVVQRTAGRVRVDLFPNSRLYGDQDEIAALQMGHVEMLAPSLTKLKVLRAPEFEVFDIPYLFPDSQAVHRVTDGAIGKALLAKLEPQGVVGLTFWDNGFKQMSANRPLRKPTDFVGLSLRTQPSQILEAQMKALGASARAMPFSEVYSALRTGTVDGTEGPVSNFYTQNLHLTQKYLTLSNHGYLGYAVVANKKFWDGLSPEIRGTLEAALSDATAYANAAAEKNNSTALDLVKKSGRTQVIELTADEQRSWRNALINVDQQSRGSIPKELIERIRKEAGQPPLAVSMR